MCATHWVHCMPQCQIFLNGNINLWFIFIDFSLIIPIILLDQNPCLLFLFLLHYVSRAQWTAHQPKLRKVLSLKLGQATLGLCQDESIQIWHIKHVELCACSISCSVGIYFILQAYEKSLLYGSFILNPQAQTFPTGITGRHNP